MSVRIYAGTYLSQPVPVHFGLNWCTHACAYCFANLNQPGRRAEYSDIAKLIKWAQSGSSTLEWWYLKNGHPMMVSNDSDPLSRGNRDAFAQLKEVCDRYDLRLTYQTKGGDAEAQDLMLSGKPTMVYVTVTTDDEDRRRAIEPGAPSFEARLDLIRQASSLGHFVVVGLNPLVPGWWNDIGSALSRIREAGASRIWHAELHLSRFQIAAMSDSAKTRHAEMIAYAQKRNKPDEAEYDQVLSEAQRVGFNLFDGTRATTPGFWGYLFNLGVPFMPTWDGLRDELLRLGGGRPVAFDFEWFDAWATCGAPLGKAVFKEYVADFGRSIRNAGEKQEARSFRDVHEWLWRVLDYPTIFQDSEIALALDCSDQDSPNLIYDDADRPVLVFVPGGWEKEAVFDARDAAWVWSLARERG